MRRLELRNVPADLVRQHLLADFGGEALPDGSVRGAGWKVRFEDGQPVRLGPNTLVPVLFVEVDGPEVERTTQFVIRRSLRGGG